MIPENNAHIKKRIPYIDLIESIAIFFVVLYHSTLYSSDIVNDPSISTYSAYLFRALLSTCVPLFFFANGYLLFLKPLDFKKHLKLIGRLAGLAVFWSVLLMPVYLVIAGEPISIHAIYTNILNLDVGWGMNIFWYIGALICMYIIFPGLKLMFDQNRKAFLFFLATIFVLTMGMELADHAVKVVNFAFGTNFSGAYFPFFNMFNPFRGSYGYTFVYFCVGGLMHDHVEKILALRTYKRNIFAVCLLIANIWLLFLLGNFMSVYVEDQLADVVWNGYDTLFTFFNVIAIYLLSLNYKRDSAFLRILSCNTLGVYFLHMLIIRLTRPYVVQVAALCNLPFNLLYALGILAAALGLTLLIRKIPYLRRLV